MKRLLGLLLYMLASFCVAQCQESAHRSAVEDELPKVLWRTPREATLQDWTCGFAGCDHAPAPPFYFVREDKEGTSAKVSVKDANDRSWSVKFGGKVVPECFASRFVSALGYAVEPSYYVGAGTLEGAPRLRRAQRMLKADGSFERARFQLRDGKELQFLKGQAWSMADNPFRGSHEFAGLRTLIMLLSNWDIKDSRDGQEEANTAVFRAGSTGHLELLYSFFDWGSTLGRWGGVMRRTRSDCSGFVLDTPALVSGVHGNIVEWGYSGKRARDVTDAITVEDLKWLAPYLERITDTEIRAGLKASGATERQTTCWAGALTDRMQQLEAVARSGL
jgi:hypothetical protein